MDQTIIKRLRAFITERSGLYFKDHDLTGLNQAIKSRMEHYRFAAPLSYYNLLTSAEKREDELRELLNIITINHTYFFRNTPQFNVLRKIVLPQLVQKKQELAKRDSSYKPAMKIWSAGCSTGEEPYSIAMTLCDIIPDIAEWDIQILATDASDKAIASAKKGYYNQRSMHKNVDQEHLDKYFSKESDKQGNVIYKINDSICNMVKFAHLNLIKDEYPLDCDIVFCRNVVIYFELETTITVMKNIHDSLKSEGYLFIGYSETLNYLSDKFEMAYTDDAIYYSKVSRLAKEKPEVRAPEYKESEETLDLDKILEGLSQAQAKAQIKEDAKIEAGAWKLEDILSKIIKCMHIKDYEQACKLIDKAAQIDKTSAEPYYLTAEIFINQGKTDQAKDKLDAAIQKNSLFAPAYYLLGCIYLDENELDQAKASLRKALFIDDNFILAHFYLAQVFKNSGNSKDAIRGYRNTLKLLSRMQPGEMIAYSGGFTSSVIKSICVDNIERLKIN